MCDERTYLLNVALYDDQHIPSCATDVSPQ
jgi:hypothetical protein